MKKVSMKHRLKKCLQRKNLWRIYQRSKAKSSKAKSPQKYNQRYRKMRTMRMMAITNHSRTMKAQLWKSNQRLKREEIINRREAKIMKISNNYKTMLYSLKQSLMKDTSWKNSLNVMISSSYFKINISHKPTPSKRTKRSTKIKHFPPILHHWAIYLPINLKFLM